MPDHGRRVTDNVTEPQTLDELVRAIYRNQQDIVIPTLEKQSKTLYGNGTPGLCQRMTTQEATIATIKYVVGITIPALGIAVAFMKYSH